MGTLSGKSVGIVGAGLLGRLLAWTLCEREWQVSLFDRDSDAGTQSCGYVGAGMLAPISELETAEPIIAKLGLESLLIWQSIISKLPMPVYFQQQGTLIIAYYQDILDLKRFSKSLQNKLASPSLDVSDSLSEPIQWNLSSLGIQDLEPDLNFRFHHGIYIPGEGQVDNRQLLESLKSALQPLIHWYQQTEVRSVSSNCIHHDDGVQFFDWVLDCRGLGAKADWENLRGVRGELIRVHAPEVNLNRPIRMMHPRYPLYIVPRQNNHYLIGATTLESEDSKPVTVQSALELLSAAFSIHSGFAEASILEMTSQCRPTLLNHLPEIQIEDRLIRINGLYRHGFLISPCLAQLICHYLAKQEIKSQYSALFTFQKSERINSHAALC